MSSVPAELRQLPVAERITLVEALWDTIADDQSELDLTEAQKAELDRRLAARGAFCCVAVGGREAQDPRQMSGRPLSIEPEAEADLLEAFEWYEKQRPGLGAEFMECVDDALERISRQPELHAPGFQGFDKR